MEVRGAAVGYGRIVELLLNFASCYVLAIDIKWRC